MITPLVTQIGHDPGVDEMVEFLQQRMDSCWDPSRKRHRIELLPKREYESVVAEIGKCQDDFSYASRNYFKIITKKGTDVSLRLNSAQELVLEVMRQLKSKGRVSRIMIIKARQLGMSTLIEALIAWHVMFFPNTRSIVVSDNADNASDLFSKLLHIYDHMPWWLKPVIDRRKEDKGLKFDEPDEKIRMSEPGLQSSVSVQSATQITGVGQGRSINSGHLSEFADWQEDKAIEIIQEDIGNALVDDPATFAFLESTAKGAGTFAHKMWRRQVSLGEQADWYPLFVPWFFDKEHVIAPPGGWRPDRTSMDLSRRVSRDWVRCDNCGVFRELAYGGEPLTGVRCWHCNTGIFQTVALEKSQIYWMENRRANAAMNSKTKKTLLQEQPSTSEEAFQISGYMVFSQEALDFVQASLDKSGYMSGHFDEKGAFHAMTGSKRNRRCRVSGCPNDHSQDPSFLKVWGEPVEGAQYVIGADVSEGIGEDYSVAWVNRIGGFGFPDVHVATFRHNRIDPIEFGSFLNFLGRWYNEALMSVEVNMYDSCFTQVRQYHQYPNNFRWKHVDSTNTLSSKWGWITNMTTKPRLYQTANRWLRNRLWICRDEEFHEELMTFQKDDPEDRGASSEAGFHDDVVMAAIIALYTSHDMDFDENLGYVPMSPNQGGVVGSDQWLMTCDICGFKWSSTGPQIYKRCPNTNAGPQKNQECRSPRIRGEKVISDHPEGPDDYSAFERESGFMGERNDPGYIPSYDEL